MRDTGHLQFCSISLLLQELPLNSVPVMEVKEKAVALAKVGSETGQTGYDTQFEVFGNSCITTGTKHVHL